jgi:16S rRNA G966 N2-methylase RsmD
MSVDVNNEDAINQINAVALWSRLKQDVEQARSFDELKVIRDKAEALRKYAKKQKASLEQQNKLAEITLRCTRRMGEILQETNLHTGGRPAENRSHHGTGFPPKLEDIGITKNDSSRSQAIARLREDLFELHIQEVQRRQEELSLASALQLAKRQGKEENREDRQEEKMQAFIDTEVSLEHYQVHHCAVDALSLHVDPDSIDFIVTDPPYPKEYLSVYADLAEFAAYVLKPGGSLLCMIGHSYLPDILQSLGEHLTYHWTLAYLTPGGQSAQLWQRKVNTFWKPLLWFVKGEYTGQWIGDVCKSAVNDNDKRFHGWGQSESGMGDIVERFTTAGQVICDPFVGGGTTAVVAARLNRYFIGCDVDESCVQKTLQRIQEALCE